MQTIKGLWVGLTLSGSNLAKAMEYTEYGSYIAIMILLLSIVGLIAYSRKNYITSDAAGTASLFAILPAWFVMREIGLLSFIVIVLIVNLVMNRVNSGQKYRNFQFATLVSGFIISLASVVVAFMKFNSTSSYSNDPAANTSYFSELDPIRNGVYSLAPLFVFLLSLMIGRRRKHKEAASYEGAFDDYNENWAAPMSNAVALASAQTVTSVDNFDQQRAGSGFDMTGRLRSLEELFNEGADEDDIYAEIFGNKKEVKTEEATLPSTPEAPAAEIVQEAVQEFEKSASLDENEAINTEQILPKESVETDQPILAEEESLQTQEELADTLQDSSTLVLDIEEKKFDLFNDNLPIKEEKRIDFFGDSFDEKDEVVEQFVEEIPTDEFTSETGLTYPEDDIAEQEKIAAFVEDSSEFSEEKILAEEDTNENTLETIDSAVEDEAIATPQESDESNLFDKAGEFHSEMSSFDDGDDGEYEVIHVDYSSVISETSKFAQIQRENAERRRREEEERQLAKEQEKILAEQQAKELSELADEKISSLEDAHEEPIDEIQSSSSEDAQWSVAQENIEFSNLEDEVGEDSRAMESTDEIIAEELVEIAQEESAIAQEIDEENDQAALADGEVFAHTIAAHASVAMDAVKPVHFTQSFSFERNNITDFQSHYFNKLTKMGVSAIENKEEIEKEEPIASEEQPLFLDEVPSEDILLDEDTMGEVDERLLAQLEKQAEQAEPDIQIDESLENVMNFALESQEISGASEESLQGEATTIIEAPIAAVVDFEQDEQTPQEILIEAMVEPEAVIESAIEITEPTDKVEFLEPIVISMEEESREQDTLGNITEVTQNELEAIIEEAVQEVATQQPIDERPPAIEDIMRAVNRAIGELKLAEEQKENGEVIVEVSSTQENTGDINEVTQENAEIVLETAPVELNIAATEIVADEIGGEVDEMNIALKNKEAVEEIQGPKEEKVPVRIHIDGLGETEAFVDSESDSIVVNIKLSDDKSKYIVDNVVVEKKSTEEPQEQVSEMPKEIVKETQEELVAETPTYHPAAVTEPAPQPTVMSIPVTPIVTPMVAKVDLSEAPEIEKLETVSVAENQNSSNVIPMDTPMTAEELEQTREFVIAPEILAAMEAMAEKEKSQEIISKEQSEETIFSHWLDLLNEDDENEIVDSMTNDEEPQAVIEDSLVAQAMEELAQELVAKVQSVEIPESVMTTVEMEEPIAEIQPIEIEKTQMASVEIEESIAEVQPIEITSEMEEPVAEISEEMPKMIGEEPEAVAEMMKEEIQEPVIEAVQESEQSSQDEFAELENQISIDNYIAEEVEIESAPINEFDPAAQMIELEEEFLTASGESAEQASMEMDIFCNQQEEYHKSQYYFLKTQIDFYKKQMGYYQKQLSVTEGQLDFYTQQADMYLKQAEFYKVQRDDEKE